ncbi:hypothetical protein GTO10_01480 [Candidatus Saccharibacteria bacterium]|nr:hypothetical protein [Candidatus Saccharibacteria bacterium]
MRKVVLALKLLLKSPGYLLLVLVLAAALFVVYFVLNDFSLYSSAFTISSELKFLWEVFANHVSIVAKASGILNVLAVGLVALLGGVNLALTVLRMRKTKVFIGRASFPGFLGTFGGAFAASCSACSTALISLVGLSGGLAILPFEGLEISLLALVLLLISLYLISKSLVEFGLAEENAR